MNATIKTIIVIALAITVANLLDKFVLSKVPGLGSYDAGNNYAGEEYQ